MFLIQSKDDKGLNLLEILNTVARHSDIYLKKSNLPSYFYIFPGRVARS